MIVMKPTLLINSGGTLDSIPYRVTPKDVIMNDPSVVPSVLDQLQWNGAVHYCEWERKDSKKFSKLELLKLAQKIQGVKEELVIVTHGTDAMPENAQFLKMMKRFFPDKTVVFTGAMVPVMNERKGYEKTDAFENLQTAMTLGSQAEPGVYIAYEGALHAPECLKKDIAGKRFEVVPARSTSWLSL